MYDKCGWGLGGVPVSKIKANLSRTDLPARCLSFFVGSVNAVCIYFWGGVLVGWKNPDETCCMRLLISDL